MIYGLHLTISFGSQGNYDTCKGLTKIKPILTLNNIAIFWSQYKPNINTFGYMITSFKCMNHIKLYGSLYHSLKNPPWKHN